MKKYIKPAAQTIDLYSEGHLLDGSDLGFNREEGDGEFSNRRHVSIWDNDEE